MSLTTSLSTRWSALTFPAAFNDMLEPWDAFFQNGWPLRTLTVPHVNVHEDDNSYTLSLAAPGLKKNDFNVEMDGKLMTVSAKREERKEEKDKNNTREEYNYSSFSRSFTLPEEVDEARIEATYVDGVLKLTLPKNGAAKKNQKTIAIK
jgi:HSP20 family protein